jgi:hypothetical protein
MSSLKVALNHHHRQALWGLGLGLLMNACTSTSTPQHAITSAVSVANHNQAEKVQDVMTGPARDAFGTPEGLAALRDKLSKVKSIATPELIRDYKGEHGEGQVGEIRLYGARISGLTKDGAPATYTAHVSCDVSQEEESTPYMKGACWPDPNGGPYMCDADTPAASYTEEVQHCRVADLVP